MTNSNPLSPHFHVYRTVNVQLRAFQGNDNIVEEAEGVGILNRGGRCPFINSSIKDPYFSRIYSHRYSSSGLVKSFSRAHGHEGHEWKLSSDLPRDLSIICPVVGCVAELTVNVLQRDFLGVETQSAPPESSPLEVTDSQMDTD